MSQSPNQAADNLPYAPASWQENANPENDAARALANADTRLLAFATRNTSIPGVDPALKKAYSEHCGTRFIEGFGDVIRSDEQLEQMRLAGDYAERYNAVILTGCPLSE